MIKIQFKLAPGAIMPKRATPGSGAFDLYVPTDGALLPGQRSLIGTGVSHQIVDDGDQQFILQGLLISRSGLASKYGVKLFFDPCLIDNDYRGEIKVLMFNGGFKEYSWKAGERLCQLAYVPFYMGDAEEIHELNETLRGAGGFGHSGK